MTAPLIFDRTLLRQRRNRAAATLPQYDFLLRDVAERLLDRLSDVTRTFPTALDLGCHTGQLAEMRGERGGIERLVQCDLSPRMAAKAAQNGWPTVVADEEALPFADHSFDLVLSCLGLHNVNTLPETLRDIRRILKPDGLFLAALAGGETLQELRHALTMAEIAEDGGASPRVAPALDIRDLGQLVQRAGFTLPVVDADIIPVDYSDPLRLFHDLRGMGQSSVLHARRRAPLRRATLATALDLYRRHHSVAEGRVRATAHILYIIGWA